MAENDIPNYGDLIIEQDTVNAGLGEDGTGVGNGRNRFGVVRDRLFHVMLVKIALSYSQHVSYTIRRLIEFTVLVVAFFMMCLLIYVHIIFNQFPGVCLNEIQDIWPKKGVLRVEVIQNWDEFQVLQMRANQNLQSEVTSCNFDLKRFFTEGPQSLPDELKSKSSKNSKGGNIRIGILSGKFVDQSTETLENGHEGTNKSFEVNDSVLLARKKVLSADSVYKLLHFFRYLLNMLYSPFEYKIGYNSETNANRSGESSLENMPINNESTEKVTSAEEFDNVEETKNYEENDYDNQNFDVNSAFVYVVEYSLYYGLLKLSPIMRHEFGVPVMLVQLDAESDKCFGDWKNRFLMRYLVGFEDIIISSVRALAENETEQGFLRDMISGEHYYFVSVGISRTSYLTALLVMLIFTFAISMLLRFSHHQIFLFIVDLLHMFDSNQPLIFPVAPLLTVILALVGMEAIMSEIFNDTTTAFYVILLVWMADQYDAICCKSSIGKRFWLRFFYLYHFAFYAYHYRFSGQNSGLALMTSACFILHSMIFFFHHYEMPLIVYQERLRRIVSDLQRSTINSSATSNVSVTITENTQNTPSSVVQTSEPTIQTTSASSSALTTKTFTNQLKRTTSEEDKNNRSINQTKFGSSLTPSNHEENNSVLQMGEDTTDAVLNEASEELY